MTYRIALLEDNPRQLEKLEAYLSKIPNVEIVLKSRSSNDFFEQISSIQPDILVADLDLGNDSMTGMEVLRKLQFRYFLRASILLNMWRIKVKLKNLCYNLRTFSGFFLLNDLYL